jgi:hypothetical protein
VSFSLCLGFIPLLLLAQTSPESFWVTGWERTKSCRCSQLRLISKSSKRNRKNQLNYQEYAPEKPMILAVITSEGNRETDHYQAIARRLKMPEA